MDKILEIDKIYKRELAVVYATAFSSQVMFKSLHFNVTGPLFGPDHSFFGELYDFFDEFVDDAGERIRQLGSYVLSTFSQIEKDSKVEVLDTSNISALDMYGIALDILQANILYIREFLSLASSSNDYATVNWLSDVIQSLEKYLWKVAATLDIDEVKEPGTSVESVKKVNYRVKTIEV